MLKRIVFLCLTLVAIDGPRLAAQSVQEVEGLRLQAAAPNPPDTVVPGRQVVEPAAPMVPNNQLVPNNDARPSGLNLEQVAPPLDMDADALRLADVIASLYRSFPEIERARLGRNVAQGELTSAFGAYDTKLEGYSLSEPTGFYRNFRNGIGVARQTWWGGYLAAGYRIGRGYFPAWYKERETNKGGEFKLAMAFPLLQGRAIDPERVAVFQASLANRAAEPQIQAALLNASLEASLFYWEWVASGARLKAQQELLDLALTRGEQFQAGFDAGKFARVDVILNDSFVAERRAKLFEAEQKFRASSFKLSLFLRDAEGVALVPEDALLPASSPPIGEVPDLDLNASLAAALQRRPEIALLQLEAQQVRLDRNLASNQLLPTLDVLAEASQDTGVQVDSNNDKGRFELLVGVQGELPIQRRKARGKIQSTSAKLAQINQKLRLQRDKIGIELQSALNALEIAGQVLEQAEIGLLASFETLEIYRFAYQRGKSDLIYLNFLESKANESEIKVVDAQRNWFLALAQLQIALGLDPLEQALNVSALPPSDRPGPGNLPPPLNTLPDDFDADWEKRQGNQNN